MDFIKIGEEEYPVRFDNWTLMHLERTTKKNIFKIMSDVDQISSTTFLVNMTYSGVFGGLDLDDDSEMPITRKEIARAFVSINDFEDVVNIFLKQINPSDTKKKVKKEKEN